MSHPQDDDLARSAGGDLYSKSLALMRRLFVGNGYKLEEVQIKQLESNDAKITGCLSLDLEVQQKAIRYAGLARGGETRVFRTRDEQAQYLGSINTQIGADADWLADIRTLLERQPQGGWGMAGGKWPIPRLAQRVALVLACDLCRGERYENCVQCYGQRDVNCPSCQASGTTPQGYPCPTCRGLRRSPCPHCNGSGRSLCRDCQGQGFFTEETTLSAIAHGHFQASALGGMPTEVMDVLDKIGTEGLADGHALITPDVQADAKVANALHYTASIPWGKFNLELGQEAIPFFAVGQVPVLTDFPYALDDVLQPIYKQLNVSSFHGLTKQFRILRELRDALAKGVKPATFFTRKYPYALSAQLAFDIAGRIKHIFSTLSFQPRVIAAALCGAASAVAYGYWLYNPRPDFLPLSVPIMLWDIGLALALSLLNWWVVAFAGQRALSVLMPVKLSPAGGRMAYGAACLSLALSIAMLISPFLRPEWLWVWIK